VNGRDERMRYCGIEAFEIQVHGHNSQPRHADNDQYARIGDSRRLSTPIRIAPALGQALQG